MPTPFEIQTKFKAIREELQAVATKHGVELVVDVVDRGATSGMSLPLAPKPLPGSEAEVVLEQSLRAIEAGQRLIENGSATIRGQFSGVDDPKKVITAFS